VIVNGGLPKEVNAFCDVQQRCREFQGSQGESLAR
jgi:hypothetical protein